MKVLTIIATIFIPITFIAGVYGMNFNPEVSIFNMPELNSKYGYISVWVIMALVALTMIVYFKRKRWM
ncbi:MAG: CorA family divalent cation transporter, partial [Candidatus Omnitrophota bacterium]